MIGRAQILALGVIAGIGALWWVDRAAFARGEDHGRLEAETEYRAAADEAQRQLDLVTVKHDAAARELAAARGEIETLLWRLTDEAVADGSPVCDLPADSVRRLNDPAILGR